VVCQEGTAKVNVRPGLDVVCAEEVRIIKFCGIAWEAQKRGSFFKVVEDLLDSFFSF